MNTALKVLLIIICIMLIAIMLPWLIAGSFVTYVVFSIMPGAMWLALGMIIILCVIVIPRGK